MKQLFEISWSEGELTPELIAGLIRQGFDRIPLPGTIAVTEITTNKANAKEVPQEET